MNIRGRIGRLTAALAGRSNREVAEDAGVSVRTVENQLNSVYRKLGHDASKVKTLYISVDPERDTPEVLKADLENFRLDAIGLTGTKAEIDTVVQQYGAAYEIVPTPDSAAKYTVSHTTTLYALDPQGRIRTKFRYEATVDEIVDGLHAILAAS